MTPSVSSCSMPWRNCLNLPRVGRRGHTAKCSGAKLGIAGNVTGSVGVERVARAQRGGVDQPDDVARERLLDGRALAAEHRLGVLGGERAPGGGVGEHHAALEAARADPHERHPVAVRAVHARLHLEHQARRTARRAAAGSPSASGAGSGGGASSTSASSSRATPMSDSAAPNSTGVALPARKSFSSNSAPISSSSASSSCAVAQSRRLLGRGAARPARSRRSPRWRRPRCG